MAIIPTEIEVCSSMMCPMILTGLICDVWGHPHEITVSHQPTSSLPFSLHLFRLLKLILAKEIAIAVVVDARATTAPNLGTYLIRPTRQTRRTVTEATSDATPRKRKANLSLK